MKQQVKISTYSIVINIIALIVIGAVMLINLNRGNMWFVWTLAGLLHIIFSAALFYMPLSISVNDRELCINRPLKVKSIALDNIASVVPCPPTMGERRICGSGGWFGYWGWFSERDLGKYFAYYGRASDCFLVTLKDGHRYMLGCSNPQSIIDYINNHIK